MEESHTGERGVGCVVEVVPGGTIVRNRDKSRQRRPAVWVLGLIF